VKRRKPRSAAGAELEALWFGKQAERGRIIATAGRPVRPAVPSPPILPGLPGGAPYRRRVVEQAEHHDAILTRHAMLVAFTGERWIADKWNYRAGFPQRIPDLEPIKQDLASRRAQALGLIDPTRPPGGAQ
jgi:hypothetical protein